MITISDLKITSRQFINLITRNAKIELNDIRTLKYETGVMPRKLVSYVDPNDNLTKQKETPYLNDDEFVIFDVIVEPTISGEVITIDDKETYKSHMPFTLIINIYGDEASDELQYMMSRISTFSARHFLLANGISIAKEPNDWQVLDGKENGLWWIRRRVEIHMNAEQTIDISDDEAGKIETIDVVLEIIEGSEI